MKIKSGHVNKWKQKLQWKSYLNETVSMVCMCACVCEHSCVCGWVSQCVCMCVCVWASLGWKVNSVQDQHSLLQMYHAHIALSYHCYCLQLYTPAPASLSASHTLSLHIPPTRLSTVDFFGPSTWNAPTPLFPPVLSGLADQTSRHLFFQNNTSAMFCAPPQVPVCYMFKVSINCV